MLSVSNTDGPAFNTRSQNQQHLTPDTSTAQPSITPVVSTVPDPTPTSLTTDRLEPLLQMQKTNPFCKRISKHLSNGKAPQHETDLFAHIRGLLYKHVTDSGQKILALVIPKSWKYIVLVERNTHTYCLIKHHYYWKGINMDIRNKFATVHYATEKKPKFRMTLFR